jgi:hypothetical protein
MTSTSTPTRPTRHDVKDTLFLATLIAASSVGLAATALHAFDFYDMSGFLDAGYRVAIGQEPYVDFYYIAGPVHLWMHALFFRLLGFTKFAILAHLLVVNALVVYICHAMARRALPSAPRMLATALTAVAFYGQMAHPWYDQNAHFWFLLALGVAEIPPTGSRLGARLTPFLCGCLVAVSFLTKANIGAAGVGFFAIYWVLGLSRYRSLGFFVAGLLAGASGICLALESPSAMVVQNFVDFRTGERFQRMDRLLIVALYQPFLHIGFLSLVPALMAGRRFVGEQRLRYVRLLGFILLSVFSAFTGSMRVVANAPLVGFAVMELMALVEPMRRWGGEGKIRRRAAWFQGAIMLVAAFLMVSVAVEMTGVPAAWHWQEGNLDNRYRLKTAAFAGWSCDPATGMGVDYAVDAIRRNVGAEETLFIVPNPTFLYGLSGRRSFAPAPFLFTWGEIPAGETREKFFRNFLEHPPDWVLIHNERNVPRGRPEMVLPWIGLDRFLIDHYTAIEEWGDFILLHRGPEGADWAHFRARWRVARTDAPPEKPPTGEPAAQGSADVDTPGTGG